MLVVYPGLRLESWRARLVCGCLTTAMALSVSGAGGAEPTAPAPGPARRTPAIELPRSRAVGTLPTTVEDAAKPAPGVLTTGEVGQSLEQRLTKLAPSGVAPCAMQSSLEHDGRTYVACGEGGVWVVELDAAGDRLLGIQHLEGSVVGLFERGGRVWVELQLRSARPLGSSLSSTAAGVSIDPRGEEEPPTSAPVARPRVAPAAGSSPAEIIVTGRVLSSGGGRVVVDLGRSHGVGVGSNIEFVVPVFDENPLGRFERRDVVAVGRVSSVSGDQSLVELGVGEEVPLSAEASVSSRALTSSRSAPPRVRELWTVAGVVRAFFVLEELGAGGLNELSLGYQSRGPLRYQVQLSPVAFASAGEGSTFAALAIGLISYDTRLFELGLGFGFQTVNDGGFDPGSGLTVAQSLRFGALDGLNLSLRNDVSLFHSEFEYSAFSGEAQIPVSERGWMVIEGGGGTVGYAFFEVGGKVLLSGNGTSGSVFLRGTIGYGALFENRLVQTSVDAGFISSSELYYGGPLLGFGVEWRR